MSDEAEAPVTLGDKLRIQRVGQTLKLPHILFLSPVVGFLSWWSFESTELGIGTAVLCAVYFTLESFRKSPGRSHFIISGDQQGFMKTLKLSDKTAIFDGSNIYQFGVKNGVGIRALAILIQELRSDGFRVVCFFDANIFFVLLENGEFQKGTERFSIKILQRLFGLRETEIYVVPSGNQADKFVIESLSLLPISFAVTNDRFRDYEAKYDFLAEDKQWRKGVTTEEGNLLLYKYNFKHPLVVQGTLKRG